jgi:DNA-binding response OmpR family regulator
MKEILLIEPDSVIALLSEKYLRNNKYEVEHCTDGKDALDLLGSESYDVVLFEIDLNRLSGLDVLKLMKRQYADIPFIFYSVNDTKSNRIEA